MDSFGAAYNAGKINIPDFLAILPDTLKSESWEVNVKGLTDINRLINYAEENEKAALRKMGEKIYLKAANDIGFASNTEMDKSAPRDAAQLRNRLLSFMALNIKNEDYIKKFNQAGKAYIGYGSDSKIDKSAIESNLVTTALTISVLEEKLPYAKELLKQALASTDDTFHGRAYAALSSTTDLEVAEYLLPHILNPEIKDNQALTVAFNLLTEDKIDSLAWPWLQVHFDEFLARLPDGYKAYAPYLFNRMCSESINQRMETFLKPKLSELAGAESNYGKVKEYLAQCTARKAAFKPQITKMVKDSM